MAYTHRPLSPLSAAMLGGMAADRRTPAPVSLGHVLFDDKTLGIACTQFPNGRVAVYLTSGLSMYCRLAVNLPGLEIEPHQFFAKTYDENEALREPLLATGLFEDTGIRATGGFVDLELWQFTPRALALLQAEKFFF